MRRYLFKLYPTPHQAAQLHEQRKMMADLWNALLQRYEDITRRTQQRQVWFDASGERHVGVTVHCPSWQTLRYARGELATIGPSENGRPKRFTAFDMQNEITHLCNEMPEWRAMSVWCGHRTAALLDRAFTAFFSRAAKGAGAQSGYPRYRRRNDHSGIPHRFTSGCKLQKDPRHPLSWTLRLKGVEGGIYSRGAFPALIKKWTDADVVWRDRRWWVSVCVDAEPPVLVNRAQLDGTVRPSGSRRSRTSSRRGNRRSLLRQSAGIYPVRIEFDLVECFARVSTPGPSDSQRENRNPGGRVQLLRHPSARPEWLPDHDRILVLQLVLADLQAAHDLRWPRGRRRTEAEQEEFRASADAVSKLWAKLARVRRNSLHVWTTRIVEGASDITVVAPPIKEFTQSPRGDERSWGANISPVSALNRLVLAQSPSTAIAMLVYKAKEAGIRCDVVADQEPKIQVGRDLVVAGKTARRARRKLKDAA